jgi:hypothetical protein
VTAHALLSASGSKVWLTCTKAPRFCESIPDQRTGYADEGTYAHTLFEQGILTHLNLPCEPAPPDLLHYHTAELSEAVADAVLRMTSRIDALRADHPDLIVLVEQKLDYSPWAPEGFGTSDLTLIYGDTLEVWDYKHGKGVYVEAVGNTQMRLYGLGALNEFGHLYDIKHIVMGVLQPRMGNWGTDELEADELLNWAENFVKPRAALAWAGEGAFVPGEHCSSGFCRARYTCAARAEANLQIARQEFSLVKPEMLTEEQIAEVLSKADQAIKWLKDVQDYALERATKHGKLPIGFKLVEGKSNRKYIDHDKVAETLTAAGVPEAVIYERTLLGITAMEKALGKKKFAELLDGLVVKPEGKPTLVADSDKREAINSAAADFSD